jgi:hypothetical protein
VLAHIDLAAIERLAQNAVLPTLVHLLGLEYDVAVSRALLIAAKVAGGVLLALIPRTQLMEVLDDSIDVCLAVGLQAPDGRHYLVRPTLDVADAARHVATLGDGDLELGVPAIDVQPNGLKTLGGLAETKGITRF